MADKSAERRARNYRRALRTKVSKVKFGSLSEMRATANKTIKVGISAAERKKIVSARQQFAAVASKQTGEDLTKAASFAHGSKVYKPPSATKPQAKTTGPTPGSARGRSPANTQARDDVTAQVSRAAGEMNVSLRGRVASTVSVVPAKPKRGVRVSDAPPMSNTAGVVATLRPFIGRGMSARYAAAVHTAERLGKTSASQGVMNAADALGRVLMNTKPASVPQTVIGRALGRPQKAAEKKKHGTPMESVISNVQRVSSHILRGLSQRPEGGIGIRAAHRAAGRAAPSSGTPTSYRSEATRAPSTKERRKRAVRGRIK